MNFDIEKIRQDFPILHQQVYNKQFVYLDSAATAQKPQVVVDTLNEYYLKYNSNIHRGVHYLSGVSTQAYEDARETVKKFINAQSSREIVFTRGTTESVNLIAFSFGEKYIGTGDEIIISEMEHHSNIVPWQMVCERKGAILKVVPFNDNGELEMEKFKELISDKTKIIAITQVSNTLGTVNPIKEIIELAHSHDIPVMIDGAQGIQHSSVDVQELDVDFYVFSGHKIYGPTGIGVMYGKEKWLEELPPYQGGGDMISTVTFEKTVYNEIPFKFEAGTADYIGAIGLAAALDYLTDIGLDNISSYEKELEAYAMQKLTAIEGLRLYGTAKNRVSAFSFLVNKIHHYDMGVFLDKMGFALRTGNHCTQPVMDHYGIDGTVRASFALYNTKEEVDALVTALNKIIPMLS